MQVVMVMEELIRTNERLDSIMNNGNVKSKHSKSKKNGKEPITLANNRHLGILKEQIHKAVDTVFLCELTMLPKTKMNQIIKNPVLVPSHPNQYLE
mmetsp:Transcript_17880/g.21062  ORF Transcript_17880/g.21062 Transcript_17880/m.21062 type:complete len:96 (-) Transcript_17880:1233-1520(-)